MRLTRSLALLAVLVGASAVTSAPASAAEEPPVVTEYTAQQREDALAHWTPERMRDAAKSEATQDTGPLTKEWKDTPLETVGRLYFTDPDDLRDSYCTATSVAGDSGGTVVTAAHCLTSPGREDAAYGDLVFAPGYHEGEAPHGVFPVRAAAFPHEFTTTDQAGHDIGVVQVDPVDGRSLTDTVGANDVDLSGSVGEQVTTFGYPMSRPQLGQRQLYCESEAPASPTAGNLRINCDMVGGASGGPWFADFDPATRTGRLVSVTSAGVGHLDGAVFGDNARVVFDAVADK
ncbi:trypsin-like serine peptidase [Prauserella cavernicola]|uniref:Trypsin-like peptidase domain-containing protein n=1 Tax=Prauserella cavernicola TaxID=2800127 RepID=A0A934QLW9_9PSEU|nr:trypsin-like peptidase domain-containing protein [Prauserella cavernicola]MBK1783757.1 trypsin-like peptidase domain-containing protein [Prauserella cavernicola]